MPKKDSYHQQDLKKTREAINRYPLLYVVVCLLILFIFGGIFIGVNFADLPSSEIFTPLSSPSNRLTLGVSPGIVPLLAGQTYSTAITSKSDKEILVIDLYLGFNPQIINQVSIQPGDLSNQPIIVAKTIDPQKGAIYFSLASVKPTQKQGTLARVSFTALKNTTTQPITIDNRTLASLKGPQKASIQIVNQN